MIAYSIVFLFVSFPFSLQEQNKMNQLKKATFGAGCFWCVEAVFERLDGVQSVEAEASRERNGLVVAPFI